jgi:hypothetical protein
MKGEATKAHKVEGLRIAGYSFILFNSSRPCSLKVNIIASI